ncbi:MAG: DUF3341 domain-containing protein [Polyangiaceae bacterium]|nr:DUF3341 domain-containing protein [Polyangiaceae bacterium]
MGSNDGQPVRALPVHVLVFEDPARTVDAVRRILAAGFVVADVHSPFPLHGLDEVLGVPETRLPWATLTGAALGCGLSFGFQAWTHTASWPLNIGGKPNLSLPALVPIAFELTVLFAALFTVLALIGLAIGHARRRARRAPLTGVQVTDDRFAVLVPEAGAEFPIEQFRALCNELGPTNVSRLGGTDETKA